MSRIGQAREVATTVLFLAFADSSLITGIELFIDSAEAVL